MDCDTDFGRPTPSRHEAYDFVPIGDLPNLGDPAILTFSNRIERAEPSVIRHIGSAHFSSSLLSLTL
jgi:hypothetical protein